MNRRNLVSLILLLTISLICGEARAQPCCGPVTPDGQRLVKLLDESDVEQLWLPGRHVIWRSGEPDPARPGPARGTHCSAYAAAMAQNVNVPLLHPPEHSQILLANAQYSWLSGPGLAQDWRRVDAQAAQSLANQGWLVLAVFANPDTNKPGHIAIIRPGLEDERILRADGPQEAQAGERNWRVTSIKHGFAFHKGAWLPGGAGGIKFFAHRIEWAAVPESKTAP